MIQDKNMVEFESLSYQDFYEDKILLIEYDMTPNEILDCKNPFINVNHQLYHVYFNKNYKMNRPVYLIEITFDLPPKIGYLKHNLRHNMLNKTVHKGLSKEWKVVYSMGTIRRGRRKTFNNIYLIYRHKILLSWEEITDQLYLHFIIKSASEYLKQKYEDYDFNNENNIEEMKIYFIENREL